jgi:hypothetical protein
MDEQTPDRKDVRLFQTSHFVDFLTFQQKISPRYAKING